MSSHTYETDNSWLLTFEDHIWCFMEEIEIELCGVHQDLLSTELDGTIPPRSLMRTKNKSVIHKFGSAI